MRRTRLVSALSGAVAAVVVFGVGVGTAAAHVEPDPSEAPKGGSAEIAFRVPTERDDANTVKVVLAFPTDHPIPSVSVEAKPGWTISVEKAKLATPVETDDGAVSEAVSRVTWSGGSIPPGQFSDFTVSLESIPSDTDELVFKTLQTYSDGQVVRWIEPTGPDGKEPDFPAPTVKLVAADSESHGSTSPATTAPADGSGSATAAVSTKGLATKKDVDSAKTVGIIGVVLGAAGLLAAGAAIAISWRRSPTSTTPPTSPTSPTSPT